MNHFYSNIKLMLVALFACVGIGAWADEVTDVLNQSVTGNATTSYAEFSGKTATSEAVYAGQCAGSNESIQLRSKNNNSGVVSTTSGGIAKKIVVTWNASTNAARVLSVYGSNNAYNAATDLYDAEKCGTLIGELAYADATNGVSTLVIDDDYAFIGFRSKADALYLTSVAITWETGQAAPAVATPVISPSSCFFTDRIEVTATCATEGATIYYSTNGADPNPESSPVWGRPLPFTQTTTIKAIAVKGEDVSAVATATFTKIESYSSFSALNALESGTPFIFTKDAFIIAKPNDKYVYLYDGKDFGLIYDSTGSKTAAAAVGKYVSANWQGTVSIFRQLPELIPDENVVVNDSPAQPVSYPDFSRRSLNAVVALKNVTSYSFDGKKMYAVVNNEGKDISEAYGTAGYNQFGLTFSAAEAEKTYEIIGAIGKYNDQLQFWPISITEETEPTPEPELGFYVTGSMVEWGIVAANKMTMDEELEKTKHIKEFSLTMSFKANDGIKVASSYGVDPINWFPAGSGNEYVVEADGEYTVYCRPNFDGDETWIGNCLKVVPVAAPVTVQSFKLNCARGYVAGDGTKIAGVADAESASVFAIIPFNEDTYLYDVTNKAFVCHTTDAMAGTTGNAALESDRDFSKIVKGVKLGDTKIEAYPYYLEDSWTNWLNMDGSKNLYMNTWKDFEGGKAGNTYAITVVDENFDVSEAVARLEGYYNPSAFVRYVISDEHGVVFSSDYAPAFKGEVINALPESLKRAYCTYNVTETTVKEGKNDVNVTVSYDLPITLSASYNDATWYYATLRGSKYVRADENVKDASGRYSTNTTNEKSNAYKWAFVGNPYKLSIINKEAGEAKVLYAADQPVMQEADPATDVKARWILAPNGDGFSVRSESGATLYINDASGAGNLGYWNSSYGATDAGSKWAVEAVPATDVVVTYKVVLDGNVIATKSAGAQVGGAVNVPSVLQNAFISSLTPDKELISADGEEITVTATLGDMPFEFSTSYDEAKWYYMNLRNKWASYGDALPYKLNGSTKDESVYGQWAFIGSPYGVKVINRAAGRGLFLTATATNPSFTETEQAWVLGKNNSGFTLHVGDMNYMNDASNKGVLGYWNNANAATDGGSAFKVEAVPTYTITVADGLVNGSIEVSKTVAYAGEDISLSIQPAEGFRMKTLTVMAGEEEVRVADDNTFVMPAANVTISATFNGKIYIETDLTSQFAALTNVSNWISGTSSNCGVVAAQFGPKVTVNGQKVQLIENYVEGQAKKQATGDVMYQTVTGLAAGTYSIELYGAANLTAGRSDMTTDFAEGDEASQKAVYLYAMTADGSTVKKYIPCLIEDNFNNRGGEEAVPTAKLEGIVVGEDGKVQIGIYKEVGLTNWHFVQLKSVIATVDADDALAPHVAAVRAIEESTVPPALYAQIENALMNYDNRFDTADDYLDAIAAIDAIAAKAKAYAPIAELLAKGEEYKAHVAEGNEAIATYEAAVAEVKAAFTDVAIPDFAAAQATVAAALPALGKAQTKAGADMTLFAENLAWTCPQGNGPGNYQGCTETYTDGSYTTGKVMYQKVEGLPAGFYKVEFIAVANHARGASAFGENIAQVYANDATENITVEDQAACTPADYVRTLTTFVKDGVLEYGLQNIADGGNWYVAKLNAITLVEPANPAPTNLDFAETEAIDNAVTTYAKDMAKNSTTYFGAQAVDGWTALNPSDNVAPETEEGSRGDLDQRAGAVVAYGSTAWLGGSANVAPAAGPEGSNGKGLGMVAVWTATVQYTQPVTLDAGTYTLEIPVYNSVGGTTVPAKSLIGFIASDGTEYLAPAKAYAVNTWTTETVTFTLDKTTNGVFSLGYTMTNNGNGNAPHLFFDCINIITDQREALRTELKAALSVAQATIEAKANVGDKLFQKPEAAFEVFNRSVIAQQAVAENEEATVEQLQTAIATLADASAAYDAALNTPAADQAYAIKNNSAEGNLSIHDGTVTIEKGAKVFFTAVEGGYALSNEDGKYVFKTTANPWTLATTENLNEAYVINANLVEGGYTLQGANGLMGTDNTTAGSAVYANKTAANNGVWTIEEWALPAVVLNGPTLNAENGTQAEPKMYPSDFKLMVNYSAENLEANGYNADDLKVKVTVMVSGDITTNMMMGSQTVHRVMGESFYIPLGETEFPVALKPGYYYQSIAIMAAQLVKPGAGDGEPDEVIADGMGARLIWVGLEPAAVTTYAVNIADHQNGTVEADKTTAAEGETVNVTVTPAEGYMVDEAYWTFIDGAGTPQKNEFREPEEGNSASFTMPAADVTITITFKEIPAPGKEYQGLIEQTLTTPDGAVMGSDTGNQTVTITAAGEGKVNITFSGFKFPIMPTTLPEFTIEGVKTEETNGIISYAINDYTLVVEGSGNGQMGGATAMYTVNLQGTQEGAEATPVMMMTLETRVLNTVYFGADADAIAAYKAIVGIKGIKAASENAAIYDLSGRKVEKMVKGGIYIVNGKKVSFK